MRWWDTRHRELMHRNRAGHVAFRRYSLRVLTAEGRIAAGVLVLCAGLLALRAWG